MHINDMISVLEAARNGQKIQHRRVYVDSLNEAAWCDAYGGCSWDFSKYEYRIKPEPPKPREVWIRECSGITNPVVADGREGAVSSRCPECRVTHFREVPEGP